jgi:hypothetical protein
MMGNDQKIPADDQSATKEGKAPETMTDDEAKGVIGGAIGPTPSPGPTLSEEQAEEIMINQIESSLPPV